MLSSPYHHHIKDPDGNDGTWVDLREVVVVTPVRLVERKGYRFRVELRQAPDQALRVLMECKDDTVDEAARVCRVLTDLAAEVET